jgi:hypothetical protein
MEIKTMGKYIEFTKSWSGLSASMTVMNKVSFYAGSSDKWALGFQISFYDRSFTLDFLKWYVGFEIWHKAID